MASKTIVKSPASSWWDERQKILKSMAAKPKKVVKAKPKKVVKAKAKKK
jgi:hypothetical protein